MLKSVLGRVFGATFAALLMVAGAGQSIAGEAAVIDDKVNTALKVLYDGNEAAQKLGKDAKAIMVFPDIVKAGVIVGGQYGKGAMRDHNNKTTGYYSTLAASYGLQLGVQKFGYAMFLMNDDAVRHAEAADGWEIGTGPSIVVLDSGAATDFTTKSYKDDIYVFFFDQSGLMAGLGIQGTKVSKIDPDD
jgi:lipid-binding SYLF domain-containing protein